MEQLIKLMIFALLSPLYVVSGLPGVSDFALEPERRRKLPEYNCEDLFSVNETEIERIRSRLTVLEKKFDLIALNYTVRLDCLYDEEMKYIRHFLVTTRGKTILRYAVEAEYFPLKLFGLKSTVLDVNVTPVKINHTGSVHDIYSLANFTFVSQSLVSETGFEAVCYSTRVESELDFATFLFIPKGAVFKRNNIYCVSQADSETSWLESSKLVFAVYALSVFACLHINLLDYLILDDINRRKTSRKLYHTGETPFSFERFLLYLSVNRYLGYKNNKDETSHMYELQHAECKPIKYTSMCMSIMVGLGYMCFIYGHAWQENIVFINDPDTLSYILETYSRRIDRPSVIFNFIFRALYYWCSLVYFVYAFVFFQQLKDCNIAFNIFNPQFVFTSILEGQQIRQSYKRKHFSSTLHFSASYRRIFNCRFWQQIFILSCTIPDSRVWKYIKENMTVKTPKAISYVTCSCLFVLIPVAFTEKCALILFAIANMAINITFVFVQAFCPVLKYFFTGFAERLHNTNGVRNRLAYCIYGLVAYIIIWCVANVFIFNTVALSVSFVLYITIVAIPFNPTYGVPLVIIILSLVYYLFMFYDDFQSDYKMLLETIFEILDDHFVKKDTDVEVSESGTFDLKVSNKVRTINVELFNHLSKKYIPISRKIAFLFIKVAFAAACIVISFNALEESGTSIESLKLSEFFSVILLVMIPGIFRYFAKPREDLRQKILFFHVFKYLKKLDRKNKLEDLIEWDKWNSNSDSSDSEQDLNVAENNDDTSASREGTVPKQPKKSKTRLDASII